MEIVCNNLETIGWTVDQQTEPTTASIYQSTLFWKCRKKPTHRSVGILNDNVSVWFMMPMKAMNSKHKQSHTETQTWCVTHELSTTLRALSDYSRDPLSITADKNHIW